MLSLETYRAGFGGPASKCHYRWIGDSGGRLVLVHQNADPFFVAVALDLSVRWWGLLGPEGVEGGLVGVVAADVVDEAVADA